MLEQPELQSEKIISALQAAYGLTVSSLEFLPLGYDSYAAVYRLHADDGQVYFLKLRQGAIRESALVVPRYLRDGGVRQVIAPLPTKDSALWTRLHGYTLILYPFVNGRIGMKIGLSVCQWTELGAVLKAVHTTALPFELAAHMHRETFAPKWADVVHKLQKLIGNGGDFADPLVQELATFWRWRWDEIDRLVARADELGRHLQAQPPNFVLCHADIHTANILIDEAGDLHIVDWDETLLAPKERDLMFVVDAAISGGTIGNREIDSFWDGYGRVEIDWLTLTYYRYEWVVQEIGEFGALVFLRDSVGVETRRAVVREFIALFQAGDVVEAAYRSERNLPGA